MKVKFENKILLWAILITFIPLALSFTLFIEDKLSYMDEDVRNTLKETAFSISEIPFIQEDLSNGEINSRIQEYTKHFIEAINDVDIIVVADMRGVKYSHLDEKQIGQVFVNEDKKEVLTQGSSYYSLMKGSMGETLRWFQPVMYNGKQVGFIMVGKYYNEIQLLTHKTLIKYMGLFILVFLITILISKLFARKVKKAILGMEPEEIAALYKEKKIILNTVSEGIIALNKNNEITEINDNCYKLIDGFSKYKVLKKLLPYIEENKPVEMKEIILQGKKVFVTIQPIMKKGEYLGSVITLMDRNDIRKIAKEITGVDEVVKNLRANVHEFRNNLHVILGLIQLGEYEEARKYILKTQKVHENNSLKFSNVEDYYVRGLLLSRELVAKERGVNFVLTEESFLFGNHNYVDSYDIVTILGNLIENAFDSCVCSSSDNKEVEVTLYEDDEKIELQVRDNGKPIDNNIKERIFELGVSSKGEGRGTGLSLVKNRVELYDGCIDIEEFNEEKIFIITILKGEK
ncbi:sensor histidine kinase [Clostridium perfringens]|nr:sensor histidine kinase [Clostridium perfringens]EHA1009882.1 sensor histidine kinase [Clostridium perfringens]EHA1021897.1 sensor histidine kinase [Clostridium perfringens]